ncbi:MAG: hypothetical protein D6761_01540 [Candidatus Dadabacteria bacterium]|nr:MAG: hypothetical protein D6761_01540 [Candidatus Dadabacteria bacterium]
MPMCIRGGGWTALCAAALARFSFGLDVCLRLRPLDPDVLPRPLPPLAQPAWASLIARWLPEQQWRIYGGFPVHPLRRRTLVDRDCRRQLAAVSGGWVVDDTDRTWSWSEPSAGYSDLWNNAVEALIGAGVDIRTAFGDLDPVAIRAEARRGQSQLVCLNPAGTWLRNVMRRANHVPQAAAAESRWWLVATGDHGCLSRARDTKDLPLEWGGLLETRTWAPWGLVPGRRLVIWTPPGPLDEAPAVWFREILDRVRRLAVRGRNDWHRTADCV